MLVTSMKRTGKGNGFSVSVNSNIEACLLILNVVQTSKRGVIMKKEELVVEYVVMDCPIMGKVIVRHYL